MIPLFTGKSENMMEKLHYRIGIKGYVQGVGFRWSAAREANNLGITGFVRNLSDGSVYIEAEGPTKPINIFIEWCRKGPVTSLVESVECESLPVVNFTEFRIEH